MKDVTVLLSNKVTLALPLRTGAMTAGTAAELTATLGLAAASWVVAVRQVSGMDMGVRPRSVGFRSSSPCGCQ